MREKIVKLYQFDELDEKAQQKALEKLWDINVNDSYWYDFITHDIKEFGNTSSLGCAYGREFDIDRGSYISIVDCHSTVSQIVENASKVSGEYPNVYQEVIAPFVASFTAKELKQISRLEKADLLGSLYGETSKHRQGIRYNVERYDTDQTKRIGRLIDKVEIAWGELLRDLEHCYVTMLREEYEYQTSEESIKESIRANEYEFTEHGVIDY